MLNASCSTIKQAISDHLTSQVIVSKVSSLCIATLPIQTLDGRWVDVFIDPRTPDFFLVHDGGKAVNELILQGRKLTPAVEREMELLASRFGVAFSDEMFQTGTRMEGLARTVSSIGMCSAMALGQLLETVRIQPDERLHEDVHATLRQWSRNRARVQENVHVRGDLKKHDFDFTVAVRKGPTIAVSLLNPTAGALSAAERFGFKAQDLNGTPAGKWKRLAIQTKAEVWSHDAKRIVERFADQVVDIPSGSHTPAQVIADALDRIA